MPANQQRFLIHTMESPCYGDPAYTYSDVKQAIQTSVTGVTTSNSTAWVQQRINGLRNWSYVGSFISVAAAEE
jgi:hypothetical protein